MEYIWSIISFFRTENVNIFLAMRQINQKSLTVSFVIAHFIIWVKTVEEIFITQTKV